VSRGKHRKIEPKSHKGAAVATTGALALGGFWALGGIASAATDSEWEAVTAREASGDWSIDHSDDQLSVGGLQFQNPSWQDALAYLRSQGIDTSSFPAELYQRMPNVPTKAQQILAGEALLHLQGPGAWVNGNGAALSASMFDGGPTPDAVLPLLGDAPPAADLPDAVPGDSHPSADKPKHRHHKGCGHRHDSTPVEPTPEAPAEPTGDTVTVAPGDTLYGLTLAGTGDASLDNWEPLYEANKDVIGSNPDLIYPGQVLTLPWAAPSEQPPAEDPAPADPAPDEQPPASTAEYRSPLVDMSGIGDGYSENGDCVSRSCGGHSGADFTAPEGTAVRAVHSATVIIGGAGDYDTYGNHVVLNHGDGTYTLYAHLSSISVEAGQSVAAGDVIGAVGSTGNSSGPHLHFEVRTDPAAFGVGVFLDPVAWLTAHGIIN
jgi:murein DD-endopeptidase MepM/ murein hydrolase activator NlpD